MSTSQPMSVTVLVSLLISHLMVSISGQSTGCVMLGCNPNRDGWLNGATLFGDTAPTLLWRRELAQEGQFEAARCVGVSTYIFCGLEHAQRTHHAQHTQHTQTHNIHTRPSAMSQSPPPPPPPASVVALLAEDGSNWFNVTQLDSVQVYPAVIDFTETIALSESFMAGVSVGGEVEGPPIPINLTGVFSPASTTNNVIMLLRVNGEILGYLSNGIPHASIYIPELPRSLPAIRATSVYFLASNTDESECVVYRVDVFRTMNDRFRVVWRHTTHCPRLLSGSASTSPSPSPSPSSPSPSTSGPTRSTKSANNNNPVNGTSSSNLATPSSVHNHNQHSAFANNPVPFTVAPDTGGLVYFPSSSAGVNSVVALDETMNASSPSVRFRTIIHSNIAHLGHGGGLLWVVGSTNTSTRITLVNASSGVVITHMSISSEHIVGSIVVKKDACLLLLKRVSHKNTAMNMKMNMNMNISMTMNVNMRSGDNGGDDGSGSGLRALSVGLSSNSSSPTLSQLWSLPIPISGDMTPTTHVAMPLVVDNGATTTARLVIVVNTTVFAFGVK